MIPYGRQSIDAADVDAVVRVMGSDWLTQGPTVTAFERRLVEQTGAAHAVAFSSGTAALHAAAAAGGLGPDDLVATSPLSFVASANSARYVGARVQLLDIDETTYDVDPASVPADVDGLVAVHYAGLPMDLGRLVNRPRVVIEDAAHAIGARTPDGPVGNCAHSDMCCFSFHPVKTVTTGEGGAVTTNSDELAERLRVTRHHGIRPLGDPDEPWAYDIVSLGYNFRITDLQCALGLSQLDKLERFVERRNQLAERYRELLADLDVVLMPPAAGAGVRHAYHLFAVRVPDRARVYAAMRDEGIGVQVHYVPIYRFSAYSDLGVGPDDFPVTERVYGGLLSLPMFPALTDADQDEVVRALRASL